MRIQKSSLPEEPFAPRANKKSRPLRWDREKSNGLIILQPVALATPDGDGVDVDGADAHFHNGGLAAGGKGLALLDLLPGLDVNVAQPVEDRAHANGLLESPLLAFQLSTWSCVVSTDQ